ncbi:MAG: HAD family phosphatase [Elusimicrobia bacterium]|nr:HAD family phosphatase [Elusimicrobiota bacterium]
MKEIFMPFASCGRLFLFLLLLAGRLQAAPAGLGRMPSAVAFRASLEQARLLPLQAVVLDMDGVVALNSGALWTQHGQAFLRTVAPAWAEGDLKHIKWKSLPEVHRWITQNRGATLGYEEYTRRREAVASTIYGTLAALEPTLLETTDALKAAGVPVALASANTRFSVGRMIDRFQLESAFGAVVSSDDLPPDQRALGKSQTHLLALRRLGASPRHTLAVEDTAAGIEAARKAGLLVAGLRNGYNDDEDFSAAHFVIREIREIIALFRR